MATANTGHDILITALERELKVADEAVYRALGDAVSEYADHKLAMGKLTEWKRERDQRPARHFADDAVRRITEAVAYFDAVKEQLRVAREEKRKHDTGEE